MSGKRYADKGSWLSRFIAGKKSEESSQHDGTSAESANVGLASPAAPRQDPSTEQEAKPPRKRALLIVVYSVIGLLVLVGVGLFATTSVLGNRMFIAGDEAGLLRGMLSKPAPEDGISLLLVGTDRRKGWTTSRGDAVALLKLYPKTKKAYMLSVPRGTRLDIPGRGMDKATYAYAFGGASLMIETIEEFTEVPINYYVEFDYEGFRKAIDNVGGVVFTVDQGWESTEFGITIRQGRHRRMGTEALAILKSREFSQGHAQRSINQQQFLKEAASQLVSSPADIPRLVDTMSKHSKTNMTPVEMYRLGSMFVGGKMELYTAALPSTNANLYGETFSFVDEEVKERFVAAMQRGAERFPAR